MKHKKVTSKSLSNTLKAQKAKEKFALLVEESEGLVLEIRKRMSELEGVEEIEKKCYMGRGPVQFFILGDRHLFHLVFQFFKRRGIRMPVPGFIGTIPIDINDFEPYLMDSHRVSERLKKLIFGEKIYRGTKGVRFSITNMDEVEEFLDLIKLKYEFYKFGGV